MPGISRRAFFGARRRRVTKSKAIIDGMIGGNTSKPGRLPHISGVACRHYEMYEQDFDLARSWGHNAHRFSIEWSRIEPIEGKWNREAVAHYQAVIQALKKRGLEPVITLHHFTNPAWFTRAGGWLRQDSAQRICSLRRVRRRTIGQGCEILAYHQ